MHGTEPQLRDGRTGNGRVERPGERLRAEADADHGHAPLDRVPQEVALSREERVLPDLVGVHLAAQDHDAGEVVERGPLGLSPRVEVPVRDADLVERLGGDVELMGHVVADRENGPHAVEPRPRSRRCSAAISFSRARVDR